MAKEEVTIQPLFKKWKVYYKGGMMKVLETKTKTTSEQALKMFKADVVIGLPT